MVLFLLVQIGQFLFGGSPHGRPRPVIGMGSLCFFLLGPCECFPDGFGLFPVFCGCQQSVVRHVHHVRHFFLPVIRQSGIFLLSQFFLGVLQAEFQLDGLLFLGRQIGVQLADFFIRAGDCLVDAAQLCLQGFRVDFLGRGTGGRFFLVFGIFP